MISKLVKTWKFIAQHPLGSRHKKAAYQRWLRWQVGARILKHPVVMPFVEDAVLVVEPGMTGATGNIYCGLHEFEDMAFVMHILRPGDLFVDVGANVGSYSVLAGKVAGAECRSFEPVPGTYAKLQRNLRINDLCARVQSFQSAVGSGPGKLRFSTDQDTTNQVVQDDYRGKVMDVPVNTLDHFLTGQLPFMLKVDVEGFEREVLAGAGASLKNPSLCAVLLESDDTHISNAMQAAGFTHGAYDPWNRELRSGRSAAETRNHLWIRGADQVAVRCRETRKFMVAGSLI